jgi:hypothetical protein
MLSAGPQRPSLESSLQIVFPIIDELPTLADVDKPFGLHIFQHGDDKKPPGSASGDLPLLI